jgi:hypothetical protein
VQEEVPSFALGVVLDLAPLYLFPLAVTLFLLSLLLVLSLRASTAAHAVPDCRHRGSDWKGIVGASMAARVSVMRPWERRSTKVCAEEAPP